MALAMLTTTVAMANLKGKLEPLTIQQQGSFAVGACVGEPDCKRLSVCKIQLSR
jgi:hypothetical protein